MFPVSQRKTLRGISCYRPVGCASFYIRRIGFDPPATAAYIARRTPPLMNAAHRGDRVADTLSRVSTPARTVLDAGVRHRIAIGDTPALLRSLVTT
jgi:hypothetical protein